MNIYVDFDGTIAGYLYAPDGAFRNYVWWRANIDACRPLRTWLLRLLSLARRLGARIILWTDRNEDLRDMTVRNLGKWAGLFDEMQFRSGQKTYDRLLGLIIDDNPAYRHCGRMLKIWRF